MKAKTRSLKAQPGAVSGSGLEPEPGQVVEPEPVPEPMPQPEQAPAAPGVATRMFQISGDVPPEIWNRLGTKVIQKLRSGSDLKIGIEFSVTLDASVSQSFDAELNQILEDLGPTGRVRIESRKES